MPISKLPFNTPWYYLHKFITYTNSFIKKLATSERRPLAEVMGLTLTINLIILVNDLICPQGRGDFHCTVKYVNTSLLQQRNDTHWGYAQFKRETLRQEDFVPSAAPDFILSKHIQNGGVSVPDNKQFLIQLISLKSTNTKSLRFMIWTLHSCHNNPVPPLWLRLHSLL